MDLVHTQDMPWYAMQTRARLGAAYLLAGRLDAALPLLERAAELMDAGQADVQQAAFLTFVAEGYLRSGRLDAAAAMADRHSPWQTRGVSAGHRAWARSTPGRDRRHRDPPDGEHAEAHYQTALAAAESLGMRPLQAHCHLGLGKLYRRIGRPDDGPRGACPSLSPCSARWG